MKAVIMAGGQGTRFWPVSRRHHPKQFIRIGGSGRTLLQDTVARLHGLLAPRDVYVVCGGPYVEEVQRQLPQLAPEQIIIEPAGRNTAPCVGLAAVCLRQRFPSEVMLVFPSDHVIQKVGELHECLRAAARLAADGWLVTFGIRPSFPATGYGYIERGEPLGDSWGRPGFRVACFTEKPDLERARSFVASGRYDWNSGIFAWTVERVLEELRRHMPDLYDGLEAWLESHEDAARAAEIFAALPSISIDYGVMEKADRVATVPCDPGWSDVGSWKALADVETPDEDGNVANGLVVSVDSKDCILHTSGGKMVALVGVSDLVVVETPDALLVCRRERAEEVRRVVAELERRGRFDHL